MSRKQRPNKAQIAERRDAILATVPAGDVKGIWRKAVDA
jgi:hypothetical protein